MPLPSVEPIPPVPALLRFSVPLEAQDASYLAASDRIASFRRKVSTAISVPFMFATRDTAAGAPPHVKKTRLG